MYTYTYAVLYGLIWDSPANRISWDMMGMIFGVPLNIG